RRVDAEEGVRDVLAAHALNVSAADAGDPVLVVAVARTATEWRPFFSFRRKITFVGVRPWASPRSARPRSSEAVYPQSSEQVRVTVTPFFVGLLALSVPFGVSVIPVHVAITPRWTLSAAARTAGSELFAVPST